MSLSRCAAGTADDFIVSRETADSGISGSHQRDNRLGLRKERLMVFGKSKPPQSLATFL